MIARQGILVVRALRAIQGNGVLVYAFFVPGGRLLDLAEISRLSRNEASTLQGFQRKEVQAHVRSITEFLDGGPVLFPNAVILAISTRATFTASRGTKPDGDIGTAEIGTLRIPLPSDGSKEAWIVDGQQRAIGLAKSRQGGLPVPVVAFASDDLAVHREQFILVNKARPLPPRLIAELLPEVDERLPRDLAARRIPSELANRLNQGSGSPLRGLIRRPSDEGGAAVIIDTALVNAVRRSMTSPLGALAPYKATVTHPPDLAAMYRLLVAFWAAVRDAFPEAWGRPASESRLMHSAGVEAMGLLMDRVMARAPAGADPQRHATEALSRIAPFCRWTEGRWPDIDRAWNDIQAVGRDVRLLADQLARLDHASAFTKAA